MTNYDEQEELREEVAQASPDDLMQSFVRSPILIAIVLGILVHLVVIGSTSMGDIMIRLGLSEPPQDPPAATQPAETNTEAATGETGETAETETPSGQSTAEGTAEGEGESKAMSEEEKRIRDTPVGKRATDVAKPDEIPTLPDDDEEGLFDIENTN